MVEVVAGVDSCNNLHTNQMNDKILFLILLGLYQSSKTVPLKTQHIWMVFNKAPSRTHFILNSKTLKLIMNPTNLIPFNKGCLLTELNQQNPSTHSFQPISTLYHQCMTVLRQTNSIL